MIIFILFIKTIKIYHKDQSLTVHRNKVILSENGSNVGLEYHGYNRFKLKTRHGYMNERLRLSRRGDHFNLIPLGKEKDGIPFNIINGSRCIVVKNNTLVLDRISCKEGSNCSVFRIYRCVDCKMFDFVSSFERTAYQPTMRKYLNYFKKEGETVNEKGFVC